MFAVVAADGDDLARAGHGGEQLGLGEETSVGGDPSARDGVAKRGQSDGAGRQQVRYRAGATREDRDGRQPAIGFRDPEGLAGVRPA